LELRVVKDVESFGAKLQVYALVAFGQGEIFEEGHIRVSSAWLAHAGNGAWSIAEGEWCDGRSVLQDADIIAGGRVEGGV